MIKKDAFFSGVSEKEGAYIHSLASVAMIFVRYRKKHGLTQEQLAEKLGITQVMLSKMESGENNMSLKKLSGYLFDIGYKLKLDFEPTNNNLIEVNYNSRISNTIIPEMPIHMPLESEKLIA